MSNRPRLQNPAALRWRKIARWAGWVALLVSPVILILGFHVRSAQGSRNVDAALRAESSKEAQALAEMTREIKRRGDR